MNYQLLLGSSDISRLLDHAENGLPLESVALLFGFVEGQEVYVRTIELLDNELISRTEFSIDPVIQYRLLVEAEERGEELVCIFHSHPAPPYPSSKDIHNMKLNPVVWLIASKMTGTWEYGAHILQDGEVQQIPITLS